MLLLFIAMTITYCQIVFLNKIKVCVVVSLFLVCNKI
jgi:hypothetical protein